MKTQELRELSVQELNSRRAELRQEMLNLRVQQQLGQLENPCRLKQLRREVARVLTLIKQRASLAA
jgi:large subunit ribosomal protein L29